MAHFLAWLVLGLGLAVVNASFFERLLHRFVMHRPLGNFVYAFRTHTLTHHRYMRKNFNVVLPLADLCLGTLLLRSKVRFAQATGPTVPNVQPLVATASTAKDKHVTLNTSGTGVQIRHLSESFDGPLP